MEAPITLATNRTLLRVTLLAPLRELKIKCFPDSSGQTLEQFSSMPGFYLMGMPNEEGWQEPIREKAVQQIAAKIFNSELSGLGIPVEAWPNIHDYSEFKKHLKIEHLALMADLGTGPVVTKEFEL
ncbi:hypothetical protein JYU12_00495 [bacterium AH-315-K03]|nr:hypothetical protein [bacterium AH-315-K03]